MLCYIENEDETLDVKINTWIRDNFNYCLHIGIGYGTEIL